MNQNSEMMMKLKALHEKREELYKALVDEEINQASKKNIFGTKSEKQADIEKKIKTVDVLINNISTGKIEKVAKPNSNSFEK